MFQEIFDLSLLVKVSHFSRLHQQMVTFLKDKGQRLLLESQRFKVRINYSLRPLVSEFIQTRIPYP